jgi:membrane protein
MGFMDRFIFRNKDRDSSRHKAEFVPPDPEVEKERMADGHGREAADPVEFPRAGWKDIALRTLDSINYNNLSIIAAGVAFFLLLGIIPSLTAALMIYGYFADPEDFRAMFDGAARFLPGDVHDIFINQLESLAERDSGAGIAAIISIVMAVWAGTRGTKGLIQAINIAYREREKRNFIVRFVTSLILTFALIVVGIAALLLIGALPAIIGYLPLSYVQETLISWLRWPILLFTNILLLGLLYRYAPSRKRPRWRWVSVGSVVATLGWIAASAGFSFYVSSFGNFNETYGALGAAVIFLLWLYLTSLLILAGAVINAEMEHQTALDTTTGKRKPRGKRRAYVADHVGEAR